MFLLLLFYICRGISAVHCLLDVNILYLFLYILASCCSSSKKTSLWDLADWPGL